MYIAIFVVLCMFAIAFGVISDRCPKCKKVFARKEIAKRTIRKGGWFTLAQWRVTFKCKYCKHVWKEIVTESRDYY